MNTNPSRPAPNPPRPGRITQVTGAVVDVEGRTPAHGVDGGGHDLRYVLLVEPAATKAQPLFAALLLDHNTATEPLWWHCGLDQIMLIDLLERRVPAEDTPPAQLLQTD